MNFVWVSWKQFNSTRNPLEDYLLLSWPIYSKFETRVETVTHSMNRILGKEALLFTFGAQVDTRFSRAEIWNVNGTGFQDMPPPKNRMTAGLQQFLFCFDSCKKMLAQTWHLNVSTFVRRKMGFDWGPASLLLGDMNSEWIFKSQSGQGLLFCDPSQ